MNLSAVVSAEWVDKQLKYAYLAGVIDGEGFVGLVNPYRGLLRIPRLSISQKNYWFLASILELFPGGYVAQHPKTKCHELIYTKALAIKEVLASVVPYLTIKQDIATVIIAFCDLTGQQGGKKKSDREMLTRLKLEGIYDEKVRERLELAEVVQ